MQQEDINKLNEAKQYFDAISAGFAAAQVILQQGYQTDEIRIESEVSSRLDTKVSEATTPLQNQINLLQGQLSDLQTKYDTDTKTLQDEIDRLKNE